MVSFKFATKLFNTKACADCKSTQIVWNDCLIRTAFWCYIVRKAMIPLVLWLLHLLSQKMERSQHLASAFVGVNLYIIPGRVRGKHSVNPSGLNRFCHGDLLEKLLGVIK